MCVIKSKEKWSRTNPKKKKYSDKQWKEMDHDEPHLTSNEKSQPSSGQNDQLVHWWLLVHFGQLIIFDWWTSSKEFQFRVTYWALVEMVSELLFYFNLKKKIDYILEDGTKPSIMIQKLVKVPSRLWKGTPFTFFLFPFFFYLPHC
jgi:hypothetical protein